MKRVFVVFAVCAMLAGCSLNKAANNADNSGVNVAEKRSSSEYPPISSRIAQAENRLLDGSLVKLEDKKGKVVLINLWATWCGPCRQEIPHLVELQTKYGEKGFEVLGLDVDPESKEEIEEFMKEMKINYPVGWAHEDLTVEVMRMNQMSGIPQSILIDREGRLTGIFRGGGPNVIAKMKETVGKIVN